MSLGRYISWTVKRCGKADGKVGQDLEKMAKEKHPTWGISKPYGQLDAIIVIKETHVP